MDQVEATGSEKIANDSINFVRRGGTLMIYGVYANKALVHWPPSKIFGDEIRVSVFRQKTALNAIYRCGIFRSLVRLRRRTVFLVPWRTWTVARSESKAWWVIYLGY